MRISTHEGSGFTLVELMTVVLIIGILITIAIPAYGEATNNAYARSCQANQRTIISAVAIALADGESTATIGAANAVLDANSGWGKVLLPGYLATRPPCSAPGGGLYNMSPPGVVLSDKGAGQTTFVNQGLANDHLLPQQ